MWLDYTAGVFPDTDTMKLFVKDIVEDGLDLTFEHGDEFFRDHPIRPAGEPVRLEGPIRGWIRANRSGWEVCLEGRVAGRVKLRCCRCLELFSHEFSREFHLDLVPEIDRRDHGGDHQLKQEELELGYYRGDSLELDPILMEQVVLSIPENPFCTPECKGLCPVCGGNRNERECNCSPAEVSSHPFAVLKKYKISGGG